METTTDEPTGTPPLPVPGGSDAVPVTSSAVDLITATPNGAASTATPHGDAPTVTPSGAAPTARAEAAALPGLGWLDLWAPPVDGSGGATAEPGRRDGGSVLPSDRTGAEPPGADVPAPDEPTPSWTARAAVQRVTGPREHGGLADAVEKLEQVRRLESWVAWQKHRWALTVVQESRREHTRWVDAHPAGGAGRAFDDVEGGDGLPPRSHYGVSRAERLAVGDRSGIAEVACVLRQGEDATHALLCRAEVLTGSLPDTVAALESGNVTASAGQLVADEVRQYSDLLAAAPDEASSGCLQAAVSATEAGLLARARAGWTMGRLRKSAVRLREECHPVAFAERHAAALDDRGVRVTQLPDGMASLSAVLPSAVAFRIDGRLSALARELRRTLLDGDGGGTPGARPPGVTSKDQARPVPTVEQLRADVLADLLGGIDGRLFSDRCAVLNAGGSDGSRDDEGRLGRRADKGAARGPLAGDGPLPGVLLTIPASTILGGDDPGWLGRFGPIAAGDARRLASLATSLSTAVTASPPPWAPPGVPPPAPPSATVPPPAASPPAASRSTTAASPPHTGPRPVALDQTAAPACEPDGAPRGHWTRTVPPVVVPVTVADGRQYRIPVELRRALAVRDGTCRFPGCPRDAARCDVDHVVAWADGGATVPENLAHLCRKHHVLKHHSGWSVAPVEDGPAGVSSSRLAWTSPAGRQYASEQDDPAPF